MSLSIPHTTTLPPRPTGSTPVYGPPRPPAARKSDITLEQLFAGPPFEFRQGLLPDPTTARWIIYAIEHRPTGRCYVGVSIHPLTTRIRHHISNAGRGQAARRGGLREALRAMRRSGTTFDETFRARVVAHAETAQQARVQEERWVLMLQCRYPGGFNLMPPGSLGASGNATPVAVRVAPGRTQLYKSIYDAIGDRNRDLRSRGQPMLEPGVIYARLAARWTPEQALEYQPRRDGRGERGAFRIAGQQHTTLRDAADATGVTAATLRSRLHRARRRSPMITMPDITYDRRADGLGRTPLLSIPWPATGETLTATEYAARTGVPKATVIHRMHRVTREQDARRRAGLEPLSAPETHRQLTMRTDRQIEVRLRLPSGEQWTGGERELIRRVFGAAQLEEGRADRLSESGIRRRLRQMSVEDRRDPEQVAKAFGFHGPRRARCAEPVPPLLLRSREG